MKFIEEIKRPSKLEQKTAMESYDALATMLKELQTENPEIEIEETSKKIRIPLNALKLLVKILEETSKGRLVSIVPVATEMTTQAAAELLGCSRPHFIKLLEKGEIQFTKIGKHRRIRYEDIVNYKKEMKTRQKQLLIDIMKSDEESGLYDT